MNGNLRLFRRAAFAVSLGTVFILGPGRSQRRANRWTQHTLADFSQGAMEDGGANTYVAADGSIRLINQWDLNGDGYLDLVFPSSHDNNFSVDSYIYLGGKGGFLPTRKLLLPGNGARAGALADLNGDGYPDIVIANEFNGTKTELQSFIYWGGPQGHSRERRTALPTIGATAVAAADLNHDGYTDLVFASSGNSYQFSKAGGDYTLLRPASDIYWGSADGFSSGNVLTLATYNARDVKIADVNKDGYPDLLFANYGVDGGHGGVLIYWGSRQGTYSEERRMFLPGSGTGAVTVADLNQDGFPDIVLANGAPARGDFAVDAHNPRSSSIYWGSASGYRSDRRTDLPTQEASDVQVSDLNGDGFPDIVFANKLGGLSFVYWGSKEGYSSARRLALPVSNPSRCAIGDLNRDGLPDLVFANENNGRNNSANSIIYWNSRAGFDPARKSELPTLGAAAVEIGDLDRDGFPDLLFINNRDGTAGEPVEFYVYWGNASGKYLPSARQSLRGDGLTAYSSADLNRDGYVDLVVVGKELRIFWGSPKGYSVSNSTTLPVHYAFSTRIADFNRDGYLDISVADWSRVPDEAGTIIYWGGPRGYAADNRHLFPFSGARAHTVADFDGNGYLDILFTGTEDQAAIYWNGPGGFDNDRKTVLPAKLAVSAEVADLNQDGYLDIIICNLFDTARVVHPQSPVKLDAPAQGAGFEAGTYIYWGGPKGYSAANRTVLPTVGAEDTAVADLNRDGYLDLVISSYHAGATRNHPSYVYWGTPTGPDPAKYTLLPTESASGVLVADFNGDGWKDILFACHTEGANHRTNSFLYWGGAKGFSASNRALIPTQGVHWMSLADIGDIAKRTDEFAYVSQPFDAGEGGRPTGISWEGQTPLNTALRFQVRVAKDRESLVRSQWQGPNGPRTYFTKAGSPLSGQGRWMQYKAILVGPNGAGSPVLRSVTVEYEH